MPPPLDARPPPPSWVPDFSETTDYAGMTFGGAQGRLRGGGSRLPGALQLALFPDVAAHGLTVSSQFGRPRFLRSSSSMLHKALGMQPVNRLPIK